MQPYPGDQQPQYPYSQPQTPPPPVQPYEAPPPQPPAKKKPPKWAIGCAWALIIFVVLAICGGVYNATIGASSNNTPSSTTADQSQATSAPAQPDQPTQADQPTQVPAAQYPPKTLADLQALAQQGDASQVHEFHSESVGLLGVCPQPKRLVTVDPKIKGKQLAEDLLAYFYSNGLDSPCGSIVFAYHTQAEANGDGYTAGRINFDTIDSSGQANVDPNATGLNCTLTLDLGGILTGQQEYVVNYTK